MLVRDQQWFVFKFCLQYSAKDAVKDCYLEYAHNQDTGMGQGCSEDFGPKMGPKWTQVGNFLKQSTTLHITKSSFLSQKSILQKYFTSQKISYVDDILQYRCISLISNHAWYYGCQIIYWCLQGCWWVCMLFAYGEESMLFSRGG